ncbi:ADP-ribosylglycohydrolase family protein [Spirillospora sp. NPDC029432]|uniref:ADP-ribosylglycohydrolase family protein n=1 Tax=Spirillospora sp. NPDC029432 TaxID=3154599 RepID=UPI003451BB34
MTAASSYPDLDRLFGCLLGGSIGAALGAPVERLTLDEIRAEHGPEGLREYAAGEFGTGRITGETQLMARTAAAIAQASVRARDRGIGGAVIGMVQASYLSWLGRPEAEILPPPPPGPPPADTSAPPPMPPGAPGAPFPSWSLGDIPPVPPRMPSGPALTGGRRGGVGRSTMEALRAAAARGRPGPPLGTPDEPVNDSKGCGGLLRAAPCGFGAGGEEGAFELGCKVAALTNGHPSGFLPAGVLAALVRGLVRGAGFDESLALARAQLVRRKGHKETARALDDAARLATHGPSTPERVESLGRGHTAPEALAIAVYLLLRAESDPPREEWNAWRQPALQGRHAMLRAVNHSGDSDATGALAGHLLGARYGSAAFPGHWQYELENRHSLLVLAADIVLEFGVEPPIDPEGQGHPPMGWSPSAQDA